MGRKFEFDGEGCTDLFGKQPLKILHVDDDAKFLAVSKQVLEEDGRFTVETVGSAEEALEKLRITNYDAVVADYQMSGKTGLELLKELRHQGNDVPFILFSCKAKEEIAFAALNSGVDRYVMKDGDAEAAYADLKRSICRAVKRKVAEKLLLESEAKYRELFEGAMDAIFVADAETGILADCNKAATELVGRSKSELVGMHQSLLHPEMTQGSFSSVFQHHRTDKEGQVLETQVVTKTGDIKDVAVKANLLELSGKKLLQGIFRDVTKQNRLNETALFRANLLDALSQPIISTDTNGIITYWNPAAEKLYGWPKEKVVGKNITGVLDGVIQENDPEVIGRIIGGESLTGEVTIKQRDGTFLKTILTIGPILDGQGKMCGIIGISTDITEHKWMLEVMEDAVKQVAELNEKLQVVEGLTRHDIRNKLSTLNGRLFLLKKKFGADTAAMLHLKEMELASQQMLRILEFERFYVKVGSEELKCVNVENLLSEAASLFTDLKGAQLVNECRGLTVLADSLLRQMFYNLMDNTLKYGGAVKTIRVHFKEEKDSLKLIYEDDGVGVDDDMRSRLFEKGFGKGTGYGLYLIKRICEAYGWTIKETGKKGQGAKFTMTIPKSEKGGKTTYAIC